MPIEAELVYRAQDTAGRKDAAYVIQMFSEGNTYQVVFKWGKWEQYRNATLTPKTAYTGNSYSIAKNNVVEAMSKREQRGYELQYHLTLFPSWIPLPFAPNVPDFTRLSEAAANAASSFSEMQKVITQASAAVKPPEPEPLPDGRVKHTRAGFLEL